MSGETSLLALLSDLRRIFSEKRIRWYLFGAHAVAVYGRPRMTADVDVTVEIPMESVTAFAESLRVSGFQLRVDDLEAFVERTRVVPVVHERSGVPVDLVIAGPGLEKEFLDAAQEIEVGGVEIPVMKPEHLIVTKLLAGRPKDLEDVRWVLEVQGQALDLEECRRLLRLLENALGRSDLLPELEKARGQS